MATRIVLEVSDRLNLELADISQHDLQLLLMDALAEFASNRGRGNADAYVEKRYPEPGSAYPTGPARDKKIRQVRKRIAWANALHCAQVTEIATVEQDELHDDYLLTQQLCTAVMNEKVHDYLPFGMLDRVKAYLRRKS